MGKYLVLWEMDRSKIPVDAKERGAAWTLLLDMIKKDMQAGVIKDWGAFVGELGGYNICEGTEVEIGAMLVQYAPYSSLKVHPLASMAQMAEVFKRMSG